MTNSKSIKCPACGAEMKAIDVNSANVLVYACLDGCGGIYCGNKEYQKMIRNDNAINEINNLLEGKSFKPVDKTFKRICPECKVKMMKNNASLKKEIIIEECYSCGGKFIDCGELSKIKNEYSSEEEQKQELMEYIKKNIGSELEKVDAEALKSRLKQKKIGFMDSLINKFF